MKYKDVATACEEKCKEFDYSKRNVQQNLDKNNVKTCNHDSTGLIMNEEQE